MPRASWSRTEEQGMGNVSDTKDGLRTTLRDLVSLHGVSGFEQPLVAYFGKRVAGLADQVDVDRYGNVTAVKRGHHDRPRLMLSAHLDEIGFIVKGVEPTGFLRFDRLGGTADALLLSRRVWVNGHFGLIGSKAGHLQSGPEQARPVSASDLYIDVGAASAAEVAELLATYQVPARLLVVEITESTIMADPTHAIQILGRLNQMGVQLSIDDFGTGYSSMAYLKSLPVHELKVDRSFVSQMISNSSDAVIVRSTVDLGRNLGLRVVAEGVEDQTTLEALDALGCDAVQGFHVSRPVAPDDLISWLEQQAARPTPQPHR